MRLEYLKLLRFFAWVGFVLDNILFVLFLLLEGISKVDQFFHPYAIILSGIFVCVSEIAVSLEERK